MKKIITLFTCLVLCTTSIFAQVSKEDTEKAFKTLEAVDKNLAYHGDYSATISLLIEKPGKPKESIKYKIFERPDEEKMTIVQLAPEADKGNGYLREGDNLWSYDPISRKMTHTTLKEALGDSDVKIDDINQSDTHWRDNYKVTDFKTGKLGQYEVYIISLEATTNSPAYEKTTYYITKTDPRVLKEEDFSGSGRLMRTVLIPKYSKVPAGWVAVQIILRDELNKGEQTTQVVSDLTFDKLPNKVFTKAYLDSIN